jgi:hypothetical protein
MYFASGFTTELNPIEFLWAQIKAPSFHCELRMSLACPCFSSMLTSAPYTSWTEHTIVFFQDIMDFYCKTSQRTVIVCPWFKCIWFLLQSSFLLMDCDERRGPVANTTVFSRSRVGIMVSEIFIFYSVRWCNWMDVYSIRYSLSNSYITIILPSDAI